jgi:nucleoside-diphosphate-sugar epimerase/predicted dehydrogenase
VDSSIERASELAKEYGSGNASQDHLETIDSVDGAIIAAPNFLHAKFSLDFLVKGRDVLCEKPIAITSTEAEQMIDVSHRSGARLAVNLIRRRFGSYQTAKLLLNTGMLGQIKSVTCEEGRIFNWQLSSSYALDRRKAGGGVLVDWGTHNLDGLHWLFGAGLELVSYQDDSLGGVEANCNLNLKLRTANQDIPSQVVLSRTRELSNKIAIQGEKISMELLAANTSGVLLRDHRGYRIEPSELIADDAVSYFAEQVDSFFSKSSNDYPTGADALRVLSFMETCYRQRQDLVYPWEENPCVTKNSSISNSRVAIFGSSGFLGTRLAERLYLEFGVQVRAAIRRPENAARLARMPVEFVDCDLLNASQVRKAVEDCDYVVNCAFERSSEKHRILALASQGTLNLLEACAKQKVRKLIHVSSAAVHGFSRNERVTTEESSLIRRPSPYVEGKIKSEQLVIKYAKQLPVTILRPTLIYGPYSGAWTIGIIERISNNLDVLIGSSSVANIIYVDDVVSLIIQALENERANGETFIVNNDEAKVTWKEYVQPLCVGLGYATPTVKSEYNRTLKKISNSLVMLKDSIGAVRNVLTSSEFLLLLTRIPLFVKLGLMLVKGKRRTIIETNITSVKEMSKPNPKILFKYEVPGKQLYEVLTCRAVFSSDKARNRIGFRSTPLQTGISKSLQWATWAKYSNKNSDTR